MDYETTHLAVYRRRILERTENVNLQGIPMPRDRDGRRITLRLPLDRLYIRVQIIKEDALKRRYSHATRHKTLNNIWAGEQKQDTTLPHEEIEYWERRFIAPESNNEIPPEDPETVVHRNKRTVFIGSPGCGKTTILRFLARRWASDQSGCLPIFISLRDYATSVSNVPAISLREFAISREAAGDESLRRAIATRADAGDILWLVDALDEARGLRERAAEEVTTLPGRVVLTSRPVGYVPPPGIWPVYEVLPFSPEDVGDFLYRWFELLARLRGEGYSWAHQRAMWLERQLSERMNLQPLITNPLLLTFIAILAGENPERDLPRTRTELYRSYVTELLDSWEHRRRSIDANAPGLPKELEREMLIDGFFAIGWAIHFAYYNGSSERVPNCRSVINAIDEYFRNNEERDNRLNFKCFSGIGAFVFSFWEEAGVLEISHIDSEDYVSFRHLTLQEYAAATVLARSWLQDMHRTWAFLRTRLHYMPWREPILLLANMLSTDDSSMLIGMVLNAGSFLENYLHRDLHIAENIASEIHELPQKVSMEIDFRSEAVSQGYLTTKIGYKLCRFLDIMWLYNFFRMRRIVYARSVQTPTSIGAKAFLSDYHLIAYGRNRLSRETSVVKETKELTSIIGQLSHRNVLVRQCAAAKLGTTGTTASVEPLLKAVKDEDPWVRATAVESLGMLNATVAASVIIEAAADSCRIVRKKALTALKRIDLSTAVDILSAAAVHCDVGIRLAVIEILGNLGAVSAVSVISMGLGDRNMGVQRTAAEALGKIGAKEAVPALLSALGNSRDQELKCAIAEALGKIGAPEGVTELMLIALDSDDRQDIQLREVALHALGMIGTPAVIPHLMAALKGRKTELRKAAAEALGVMGASEAIPALLTMLMYGDSAEKKVSAEALSRIGPSAEHSSTLLTQVIRSCRSEHYEYAKLFSRFMMEDFLGFIGIRVRYTPWQGARTFAAEALERLSPFLQSTITTRKAAHSLVIRSEGRAAETLANRLIFLELHDKHADDLLMPSGNKKKLSRTHCIIVVLSGLCTLALLPIATNIAASNLPEWMRPYTWLAWPALAALIPITIGLLLPAIPSYLPPALPREK